jgi:2-polyprenyl-3-methyl-5-hydroxy-6-metoxy-1,4-benzoquinol methylase
MTQAHYSGDHVLNIMEKYAGNRNSKIEKLIVRYLRLYENQNVKSVLEFGAGRGEFIRRLAKRKNLKLSAVETDSEYVAELKKSVEVYSEIEKVSNQPDCIYLIDVLEHLENDEYFLRCFFEKLKNDGRLFIYVPARMELFSDFDKKIGHYRRYSKKELTLKLLKAGFQIEQIRYHEILGYFAVLFYKWFGGKPDLSKNAVKLYDKILVPATNFFEKIIPVPFGKSIYVSAFKDD